MHLSANDEDIAEHYDDNDDDDFPLISRMPQIRIGKRKTAHERTLNTYTHTLLLTSY